MNTIDKIKVITLYIKKLNYIKKNKAFRKTRQQKLAHR